MKKIIGFLNFLKGKKDKCLIKVKTKDESEGKKYKKSQLGLSNSFIVRTYKIH